MAERTKVPIKRGLFTWPSDDPRLLGSRCKHCGEVAFPSRSSCLSCTKTDVEEIELSKRGTLWTWTVQAFRPPSPPYQGPDTPDTFVPFGVGYVELPEGVIVESRLTENDPEKLKIGMEMELVLERFKDDEDGNEVLIYAFRPV